MSENFVKQPGNGAHSALAGLGVLRSERAPATPATPTDVLRRIVAWRDDVHAGCAVRGADLEALIEEARAVLAAGVQTHEAPSMLGEVWMAFGSHEGQLIALPEYAAASARAVGDKIMESARREGYRGSLRERLESLGWSVRRMSLAAGVKGPDHG